jgi:hypothetical protein
LWILNLSLPMLLYGAHVIIWKTFACTSKLIVEISAN